MDTGVSTHKAREERSPVNSSNALQAATNLRQTKALLSISVPATHQAFSNSSCLLLAWLQPVKSLWTQQRSSGGISKTTKVLDKTLTSRHSEQDRKYSSSSSSSHSHSYSLKQTSKHSRRGGNSQNRGLTKMAFSGMVHSRYKLTSGQVNSQDCQCHHRKPVLGTAALVQIRILRLEISNGLLTVPNLPLVSSPVTVQSAVAVPVRIQSVCRVQYQMTASVSQ